jgi:histidine triad (HIT) family protein
MEENCIFCKIADGRMQANLVYEDARAVAFEDINPQAPHHVLVIPRDHIASLDAMTDEHEAVVGHLFRAAAEIARVRGIAEEGYRTVVNTGPRAGQTVFHIHVHLIAGRDLRWPPG